MAYIGAGITRFNTADELTVTGDAQIDTTTLVVDSTNNRVGVGTASPATALDVTGTVTADGLTVDGGANALTRTSSGAEVDALELRNNATATNTATTLKFANSTAAGSNSGSTELVAIRTGTNTGDFVVRVADSSPTMQERLRITSGGNVGIGTSSPDSVNGLTKGGTHLMVNNDSGGARLNIEGSTDARLHMVDTGASANQKTYLTKVDGGNYTISLENDAGTASERLRIDSSGNVGIGTAAPTEDLHIKGQDGAHADVIIQAYTGYNSGLNFNDNAGMAGRVYYNHSSNFMAFDTNGSEAARIDSSGNLLVGQSSDPFPGVGNTVQGISLHNSGRIAVSSDGNTTAYLNRKTSDGDIIDFRKDGTTVGSIGSFNGNAYYAGTGCGLRPRTGDISPTNASGSTNDGGVDLGTSSNRFQNIWLSGGAYLGGTGSANHLDDYEEGTWTPSLSAETTNLTATYIEQVGRYVKVGNLVHVQCRMQGSVTSAGSGARFIEGLPFTNINAGADGGSGSLCPFNGLMGTNYYFATGHGVNNASKFRIKVQTGLDGTLSDINSGTGGFAIDFSYTYRQA
jgi:hypothetical protein